MRIRQKTVSAIILVVFAVTALFGFSMMSHEMSHSPADCVISLIDTAACPQMDGALSMALSHIGAFQSFSNSTTISSLLSLLISTLAAALIALYILTPLKQKNQPLFAFSRRDDKSLAYALAVTDERRWLSHLNNSPSLS